MSRTPSVELATQLKAAFNIVGVAVVKVQAERLPPDTRIGEASLAWQLAKVDMRWGRVDEDQATLRAVVPFVIVFESVIDGTGAPIARIEVVYILDYTLLPGEESPSDEQVEHYLGIHAFVQAWPYLRAEVQALSAKIGLPSLTLPVFVASMVPNFATIQPLLQAPAP